MNKTKFIQGVLLELRAHIQPTVGEWNQLERAIAITEEVQVLPYRHSVIVGRLQKRIDKLTVQRDVAQKTVAEYKAVMDKHPNFQRATRNYFEMKKEREYKSELEARVKEQALLIAKLLV